MKKIICILLCLMFVFALAACHVNVNVTNPPSAEEAEVSGGEETEVSGGEDAEETEESDDWQNPVMNFIGPYASGDYRALVEAEGKDTAKITVECGDPARPVYRWVMSGPFDWDTLTVNYTNCVMYSFNWDDINTMPGPKVEYENGAGSVDFSNESLSFTWRNDNSDWEDVVFEWSFNPDA